MHHMLKRKTITKDRRMLENATYGKINAGAHEKTFQLPSATSVGLNKNIWSPYSKRARKNKRHEQKIRGQNVDYDFTMYGSERRRAERHD
jgi:hypothetical protein